MGMPDTYPELTEKAARAAIDGSLGDQFDWLGTGSSYPSEEEQLEMARGWVEDILEAVVDEIRVATLVEAAADWSEWETYVASDGIFSARLHGKSPAAWLYDRADEIRIGSAASCHICAGSGTVEAYDAGYQICACQIRSKG